VIHNDLSIAGMVDACDHVQQGRFSAARFADDGDEFAAVDGQVHAFEDGEFARRIRETLDDAAQFDDRFRGDICHMDRSRFGLSPTRFHFLRLRIVRSTVTFSSAESSTSSPSAMVRQREKRLAKPISCVTMMMVLWRSLTRCSKTSKM
jgi:hypothetical protein